MFKYVVTAATALTLFTTAAQAHWDRPSCYIDVHEGCFNSGRTPCTDKEYQEWLNSCDEAYPLVVLNVPSSLTSGGQTGTDTLKRR